MSSVMREQEPGGTQAIWRQPDPRLRPFVEGHYHGYAEHGATPALMRETPQAFIPVIINFGAAWRMANPLTPQRLIDSFLSGLDEHYTLVESSGWSSCVQANLTPLGARRILARPLSEIAHRVVGLEDIFGPAIGSLIEQLRAASWPQRFALLDRFLLGRIAGGTAVPGELDWAWQTLRRRHGQVPISGLAEELGWSHKRLIAGFRAEFGLTPRRAGRVMRFARVTDLLRTAALPRWAEIAADCGYYDQAHLNRDFRAFAGVTPTDYFAGLVPSQRSIGPENLSNTAAAPLA